MELLLRTAPNVTIEHCPTMNPAPLLPTAEDREPHDSGGSIAHIHATYLFKDVPLQNSDLILSVDGSSSRALDCSLLSGYAVCTDSEVVESGKQPGY